SSGGSRRRDRVRHPRFASHTGSEVKDDRTKKPVRAQLPAWEIALGALIVAAGVWSTTLSPYYLSLDQIFGSTRFFIIPGLLALGLAMVVSLGEIDISLASTIAVGT